MRTLSAVDLFCGAGGFTEGFKQQGLNFDACLDIWTPAVETHQKNHPDTEVFQADILDFDSGALPDCDVLIGSPPCTEFSYANRGGHGDLGLGMQFVLRFLRFVHEKKPTYWVMENVPRLLQTLPARVHLRRLGLSEDGFLEIPVRRILNAADYGTPQKRLRLISGRFPVPDPTHSWTEGLGSFENLKPWVSVKQVVGLLPDPLGQADSGHLAQDPCYDLEIPEPQLTDHFLDTRLTEEEIEINRKSKTDHSWYGRMAFPDPIDRPARTVMATQTGISRETLVIEWKHNGRSYYRRPTIRECASFQSFPISYQFWGSTAQTRYKLVGNAVPPLLASALARAILTKEGARVPNLPILSDKVAEMPPPVTVEHLFGAKRVHRYPANRKFRDHIPGSKSHGVRVDFANSVSGAVDADEEAYDVRWEARLVAGSGKSVSTATPGLSRSLTLLGRWASQPDRRELVDRFLRGLEEQVRRLIDDSESLQAAWAGLPGRSSSTPPVLLRALGRLVDESFPKTGYDEVLVDIGAPLPSLDRTVIPLRALAQLVAASYAADEVNTSGRREPLSEVFKRVAEPAPTARGRRKTLLVSG